MTDPAGTTTAPGSTASRVGSGQPLADQPTVEVWLDDVAYGREQDSGAAYRLWDDDRYEPAAHRGADGWADDDLDDDLDGDLGDDLDGADADGDAHWAPDYSPPPVAVRRADVLAGLLLLRAGMAAGVSLLVVWVTGGTTGLDLVRAGLVDAGRGAATLAGSWQPLAVVGGGIVLFVLGLLMYAPARTHRLLGVLALLVSLVVAAGVLVPLADANWDLDAWAVGGWFTTAVGGLGLLGALKALSTGPRTPR